MTKTMLIMAGGTGGHVFPGIAVANELRDRNWTIHWLGTAARMEAQIVPKAGYPISFIDVAGVRGNGILRLLKAPFQIIKSVLQARKVLNQVKPQVVLGMGGFASGPGGVAAWLKGIPVVLHEQNALPGMTNRILAKVAKKVLTGFANTFLNQVEQPEKYQWVGNPVRRDFVDISLKTLADYDKKASLNLLIVGGSLGAKTLNENVPNSIRNMPSLQVRHQCGKGHLESVHKNYASLHNFETNWQVSEFIEDMAEAYQWADLVVCRAGALTVAEVAMAGVAAVFVPLPHAVDDHQTKNAETLSKVDAAYLLTQTELENGGLVPILEQLLVSPQQLIAMGAAARTVAKPDATITVADICETLVGDTHE